MTADDFYDVPTLLPGDRSPLTHDSPARWANAVADIVQEEVRSHHVLFSTRYRIAERTWALALRHAEEIGCAAFASLDDGPTP